MTPREVVLDASALLALSLDEPGREAVTARIAAAAISAVNWTEVVQRHVETQPPAELMRAMAEDAGLVIVPFDASQAERAATLLPATREVGLSLADRACLALASSLELPALTADRSWAKLEIGVQVEVIR